MRRFVFSFAVFLCLSVFFGTSAFAQSQTFSDVNAEYTFDLPESAWKMVAKPTPTSPNVEYVYVDRLDAHLEIRKISSKADEMISDVIQREQEQKLQFLPGYVAGKEENFAGFLKGKAFNYEYIKAGKNMSGRFYYLKDANSPDIYVLRFTGSRDKLRTIRNQTDSIARTFKPKK